jgi:hypothetical protein
VIKVGDALGRGEGGKWKEREEEEKKKPVKKPVPSISDDSDAWDSNDSCDERKDKVPIGEAKIGLSSFCVSSPVQRF